ncbi:MAG: hypothetical protein KFF72_21015, partial [Arthrospira sp. SH-MAG29]
EDSRSLSLFIGCYSSPPCKRGRGIPQHFVKIHDAPVGAGSPTIFALHQIICWFALGDTY